MKRNENFWSYRLHKLGTLKCCGQTDGRTVGRPDGRSGPTTRPAFAKATQVQNRFTRAQQAVLSHHKMPHIISQVNEARNN